MVFDPKPESPAGLVEARAPDFDCCKPCDRMQVKYVAAGGRDHSQPPMHYFIEPYRVPVSRQF